MDKWALTPREWVDIYAEEAHATHDLPGTDFMVALLGLMMASAAAFGELRQMPDEFEWPAALKGFNGE